MKINKSDIDIYDDNNNGAYVIYKNKQNIFIEFRITSFAGNCGINILFDLNISRSITNPYKYFIPLLIKLFSLKKYQELAPDGKIFIVSDRENGQIQKLFQYLWPEKIWTYVGLNAENEHKLYTSFFSIEDVNKLNSINIIDL